MKYSTLTLVAALALATGCSSIGYQDPGKVETINTDFGSTDFGSTTFGSASSFATTPPAYSF